MYRHPEKNKKKTGKTGHALQRDPMDLAACIEGAEHACFIHTRRGGKKKQQKIGVSVSI